jgi:type III secretion system YscD/HrpQ family protein
MTEKANPGQSDVGQDWQLRVLLGMHAGGIAALLPGHWCLVGAEADCDLILRDAGVVPHHFVLYRRDRAVVVRAVAAAVVAGSRRLAPGEAIELTDAALLQAGDAVLAVGVAGQTDWDALRAQVPEPALSDAGDPDQQDDSTAARAALAPPADAASAAPGPAAVPVQPAAARWVARARVCVPAVAGFLAVLGLVAAGWMLSVGHADHGALWSRAEQLLQSRNLPEVRVERAEYGRMRIVGTVPTEAQRSELVNALAAQGLRPTLDLVTGERLALGVENSFRQRGLAVEAAYVGNGEIQVRGVPETPVAIGVVREVLQSQGYVRAITFAEAASSGEPEANRSPPSAAAGPAARSAPAGAAAAARDPKRIVAVVGGEYGFLLTQDGTRYLRGALLPDGSRFETVDGHDVVFEKDGQRLVVQF